MLTFFYAISDIVKLYNISICTLVCRKRFCLDVSRKTILPIFKLIIFGNIRKSQFVIACIKIVTLAFIRFELNIHLSIILFSAKIYVQRLLLTYTCLTEKKT